MKTNLQFFKECFSSELGATVALIDSAPADGLGFKPHPSNRSAGEIIEHLLCHLVDMRNLLKEVSVEETFTYAFNTPGDASRDLRSIWEDIQGILENIDEKAWEEKESMLYIHGKLFVSLPLFRMLWFFFFDMIHHRGQLSTYIRPMGGKVPIIYGSSGDFPTF